MTQDSIKQWILVIFAAAAFLAASGAVHSEQLDVLLIDYPPYYTTNTNGKISGTIVEPVSKIFARAGIGYKFAFAPSKRVLYEIKKGTPLASLGWFKTAEREKFACFSLPVYRNKPAGVFVLREVEERFARYQSFIDLMENSHFSIGRIDGHSQGEYIDAILAGHQNRTVWVSFDQVQLIKMLKARRFDFILIPPEEVESIVQRAGYPPDDFALLKMDDIPNGPLRYIMYSKSVDKIVIEKIDRAIAAEIGNLDPS